MVTKISTPLFVWTDLEQATAETINKTIKDLKLHPLLAKELARMNRVNKIERYGEALLLVLQIPYISKPRGDVKSHELDVVIGKTFLITSSSAPIPAVERFRKRLENSKVRERFSNLNTGTLVYTILVRIFNHILPIIDDLEQEIETIEDALFEGKEHVLIPKISLNHRNIIDLRRALNPARPVLESFTIEIRDWFDPKTALRMRDLSAVSRRFSHLLDTHLETIAALEQTTQAIFSTKISEIVRVLAIITAIALPFTIIGSLYGMNVELPDVGVKDFWLLLAAMGGLSLGMVAIFRMKRWI